MLFSNNTRYIRYHVGLDDKCAYWNKALKRTDVIKVQNTGNLLRFAKPIEHQKDQNMYAHSLCIKRLKVRTEHHGRTCAI